MKAIKRNHLVAIAVGALLLSGSNLALAQAGDHKKENKSHSNQKQVKPITLQGGVGVLSLDTSTVVPQFQFDTSTVVPHIEIDEDHIPSFDTSTATSQLPPLQFPDGVDSHHGDDGVDDDFDTSTVVPQVEIDEDHIPSFDTSTATSQLPPLQFPNGVDSHHGDDEGDDEGDD